MGPVEACGVAWRGAAVVVVVAIGCKFLNLNYKYKIFKVV